MNSVQYMQACEPIEASCVECGIPMAKWYNEDGFQNGEYWCSNCGLSITKKVVYLDAKDKYRISYLTKERSCK